MKKKWEEIDPLLDKMPATEIAKRFNISVSSVYQRRVKLEFTKKRHKQWSEIEPLLGTQPDGEIGKRFGLSGARIAQRRYELGIPACPPKTKWDWEKIDKLMGTVPDSQLSLQFGISQKSICNRRNKLGIPVYVPPTDCPPSQAQEKLAIARLQWAKATSKEHATPGFCQCSLCQISARIFCTRGLFDGADQVLFR